MDKQSSLGLGRIAKPDNRDRNYLMADVVGEPPPTRTYRYWWNRGWTGDQGPTPECVAYSWLHWLEDGPTTQRPLAPGAGPVFDPGVIYRHAQKLDGIPGEDYAGTTVRGGAKALQERGAIESYYWSWGLDPVVKALLTEGPVVMGSNWYQGMFTPGEDGFVSPTGRVAGGHAYLLNGVNVKEEKVRFKNSWGSWGDKGHAWMRFADLERLLGENGEAVIAVEKRV